MNFYFSFYLLSADVEVFNTGHDKGDFVDLMGDQSLLFGVEFPEVICGGDGPVGKLGFSSCRDPLPQFDQSGSGFKKRFQT